MYHQLNQTQAETLVLYAELLYIHISQLINVDPTLRSRIVLDPIPTWRLPT